METDNYRSSGRTKYRMRIVGFKTNLCVSLVSAVLYSIWYLLHLLFGLHFNFRTIHETMVIIVQDNHLDVHHVSVHYPIHLAFHL